MAMTRTRLGRGLFGAALAALLLAACGSSGGTATSDPSAAPVERLRVQVERTFPHDDGAYTQGLEVAGDGRLYESTGLYGRSDVREVDLATGAVVRRQALPRDQFGEGLTRVDGELVQLTWKEGVVHRYQADTFAEVGTFQNDTQGWGICYDGAHLLTTDGSATLTTRDPQTFAVIDQVQVREDGRSVDRLNELECVDGSVYANVYQTDRIVRIDPPSGRVVATIDASGLLTDQQARAADVLNGIARVPGQDRFYLTGKLWPSLFEVSFVPA